MDFSISVGSVYFTTLLLSLEILKWIRIGQVFLVCSQLTFGHVVDKLNGSVPGFRAKSSF